MRNKFVTKKEMVAIIEEIIYSMEYNDHGTRHNTHDLLVILEKMKAEAAPGVGAMVDVERW